MQGLGADRAVVPLGDLHWYDGALAVATVAVLLAGPWVVGGEAADVEGVVMALAMAAGIAVRRVWPVATLAVVVSVGALWVASDHAEAAAGLVVMLALATVGNRCPLAVSLRAATVSLAVVYVTALLSHNVASFDASNIWLLGWLVAATGVGIVMRSRRAELAAVLEREDFLRVQEAERRVDQERLRIAQELHDTVGHTVATVTMQAGAAARVLDEHPDQAKAALETIAEVNRTTLQEIRSTLGMLRSGNAEAATSDMSPVPSLRDLDRVLDVVRAKGLAVTVERRGDLDDVPASLAGVLYRITQEAATNVVKHARDATRVEVTLDGDPDTVELTIVDDGAPLAGPFVGPPGHHGLEGMRERARAVGGTVTTLARPAGGFEVRAVIPTGAHT